MYERVNLELGRTHPDEEGREDGRYRTKEHREMPEEADKG